MPRDAELKAKHLVLLSGWQLSHQPARPAGVLYAGVQTAANAGVPPPEALTAGFQRALLVSALCLVAAGAIALRASSTRGQPPPPQKPSKPRNPPTDVSAVTARRGGM